MDYGDRWRRGSVFIVAMVLGCTSTTSGDATGSATDTAGSGDQTASEGESAADSEGATEAGTETGGTECGAPCDPWDPSCPVGQKCTSIRCDDEPQTVCRDAGSKGIGDACSFVQGGVDECAPGSTCWNIEFASGVGECVEFCGGTPAAPTCPGALRCDLFDDGTVPLCFTECDPLAQDCADPTDGCYPDFDPKSGATCVPPGTAVHAEACANAGDCVGGMWCAPAEVVAGCSLTLSCCTPLCDLNAPNTCPGATDGETCQALWAGVMPGAGWEDIGLCRR